MHRIHQRLFQQPATFFAATLAACILAAAHPAAAQAPEADPAAEAEASSESLQQAAATGQSEANPSETAAADGSALLDRFLDEVTTLEAEFVQELWTDDEKLLETQTGSLALERPSRFSWHFRERCSAPSRCEPYEQLVVADGKNLWIYDVELESATVTPIDDTVASTPAMLLSGDRAVRDGFTVVEEYRSDGLSWVRLEPELDGTDFSSVLLGFDGVTPTRLELVDGLGQITRIAFSDVVLNAELDEDLFEFDPPRGTDVIGTPAR